VRGRGRSEMGEKRMINKTARRGRRTRGADRHYTPWDMILLASLPAQRTHW